MLSYLWESIDYEVHKYALGLLAETDELDQMDSISVQPNNFKTWINYKLFSI